jgi:UDP-glucose 6-dehydrogenase
MAGLKIAVAGTGYVGLSTAMPLLSVTPKLLVFIV